MIELLSQSEGYYIIKLSFLILMVMLSILWFLNLINRNPFKGYSFGIIGTFNVILIHFCYLFLMTHILPYILIITNIAILDISLGIGFILSIVYFCYCMIYDTVSGLQYGGNPLSEIINISVVNKFGDIKQSLYLKEYYTLYSRNETRK